MEALLRYLPTSVERALQCGVTRFPMGGSRSENRSECSVCFAAGWCFRVVSKSHRQFQSQSGNVDLTRTTNLLSTVVKSTSRLGDVRLLITVHCFIGRDGLEELLTRQTAYCILKPPPMRGTQDWSFPHLATSMGTDDASTNDRKFSRVCASKILYTDAACKSFCSGCMRLRIRVT